MLTSRRSSRQRLDSLTNSIYLFREINMSARRGGAMKATAGRERVADILDAASEIGEVIELGRDAWDKDQNVTRTTAGNPSEISDLLH